MNALLTKAFTAISQLPEAEQEAIAREMLERIESDARWDALFKDRRSEIVFREFVAEAEAAETAGTLLDFDPSNRPAK